MTKLTGTSDTYPSADFERVVRLGGEMSAETALGFIATGEAMGEALNRLFRSRKQGAIRPETAVRPLSATVA